MIGCKSLLLTLVSETEMAGIIHASVQLRLPFTLIRSLVVSTSERDDREAWPYIDNMADEMICSPNIAETTKRLPVILHYCQRYLVGDVSSLVKLSCIPFP